MTDFYDLSMDSITGETVSFTDFKNTVCLVVNVASRCGLTPQYEALKNLQDQYDARGFKVLGFPCNQFGAQEPGSNEEILEFATSNYDVNFPMFAKVNVNGDGTCDLYQMLKAARSDDEGNSEIPWNFTKFVIDREGHVVARFGPQVTPEEIADHIGEWL